MQEEQATRTIARLRELRNKEIAAIHLEAAGIRERYRKRIEAVKGAAVQKMKAVKWADDPPNTLIRFCQGCKEPMLRATVSNLTLAHEDSLLQLEFDGTKRPNWNYQVPTGLRHMRTDKFCCHWCQHHKGVGHSYLCWRDTFIDGKRDWQREMEVEGMHQ